MNGTIETAISEFTDKLTDIGDIRQMDADIALLLDTVRTEYDLDSVYILQQVENRNTLMFTHSSVRLPQYENKGSLMRLSDEELSACVHMYDDSPLCDHNVRSGETMGNNVSDCILHYGFVRKSMNSYDGSIGFQMFSPHEWTDDERDVLEKLGRIFKMAYSVQIAEGVHDELLAALELERRQYRDALASGAEYFYTFDVTDGMLRENLITSKGVDLMGDLPIPSSFDTANEAFFAARPAVKILDESTNGIYSQAGLLRYWEQGIRNPSSEYYNSETDTYTHVNIFLNQDANTGHIYALVLANDVSEQRREEKRQRRMLIDATNAANLANEAKTRFLENMSHDIRTPMNAIIGMTRIAKSHIDDRSRVTDCLEKITVSGSHLLGLINDVLDLSMIESGRIEPENVDFNVDKLVQDVSDMVRPQADAKSQQLTVHVGHISHDRVCGDRQRLEQALINLVGNSIKYTPNDGSISLSVSECFCNDKVAGYEFIIADNGIGMSRDFIDHIFEPFSRAGDDRVSKVQGTGLGMAIAQNTFRMMNGSVKVDSEINKGTTFTATAVLTVAESDGTTHDLAPEIPPQAAFNMFLGKRALLAEDNELNQEVACEILQNMGLTVDCVDNGSECANRVTTVPDGYYDVIFMDIQMPVMDGYTATRAIRGQGRAWTDRVPIIAMSANAFAQDVARTREAGMNDHLAKPLDITAIARSLSKWL